MLCAFICMSANSCQRRIALPFYYYICSISLLNYPCTMFFLDLYGNLSLSLSLSIMKMAIPILFHVLTFLFVVMDQWGIDMCNLIFFFFKLYIITCNWIFNLFISIQIHPLKIWLMHVYKDTIQLEMDPRGPDPVLRFFFFFFLIYFSFL